MKLMIATPKDRRLTRFARAGFTLIEIIVALGVLTVATAMASQLVRISRDVDRYAEDRLLRTLEVDNISEILKATEMDELSRVVAEFTESTSVSIEPTPINAGDQTGIHWMITSDGDGGRVVGHVWRWEEES